MMEQSDRLRLAMKLKNMNTTQARERFNFNENTIRSNLNGNAQFGFAMAKRYARAFGVRAEWLYDGQEPMTEIKQASRAPASIPMISWVSAGRLSGMGDVSDSDISGWLALDGLPAGEYFGTEVRGDSMDRISPEGSRIVVNASDRDLLASRPYLFSCGGEATYKLWEPQPVPHLMPSSTNPANKPIFLQDQKWSVIGRVYRSILNLA